MWYGPPQAKMEHVVIPMGWLLDDTDRIFHFKQYYYPQINLRIPSLEVLYWYMKLIYTHLWLKKEIDLASRYE